MIAPEVIDAMIEAGASAEVIAAAWKADLAKQQARIAEKRAKDAERQRRHRESRDVTVTECDTTDAPALDKETPQTPKEIKPTPYVRGTRARAKHPLPANWHPLPLKPDGQAGMIVARKPAGWIERQLSKFKDHALQNNRLCSDWDAAWRNWIKEADEIDGRRTNGLARHQPSDGLSATTRAARDVFGIGASH